MPNYRKRQRAYEGEANRAAAIQRMRNSSSVAQKMTALRRTPVVDSGPRSHGGSLPRTIIPKSQQPTQKGPPQEQMQAAKRAFQRANRERVTNGRPNEQTLRHAADIRQRLFGGGVRRQLGSNANKRIPGHRMTLATALSRRSTDTSRTRVLRKYGVKPGSDGTYSAALNKAAQMRARSQKRMDYLPRRRRGRGRPRSVNV